MPVVSCLAVTVLLVCTARISKPIVISAQEARDRSGAMVKHITEPERVGSLELSTPLGVWQAGWCMVKAAFLYFFNDEHDSAPALVLSLENADVSHEGAAPREHCIKVQLPTGRSLLFNAQGTLDMYGWIVTMQTSAWQHVDWSVTHCDPPTWVPDSDVLECFSCQ